MIRIFGCALTNKAPFANYRGESDTNEVPLQKLPVGDEEYPIVSSQSLRDSIIWRGLREEGMPCYRERVYTGKSLEVHYSDYIRPEKYADAYWGGGLNLKSPGKDQGVKCHRSQFRANHAIAGDPYQNTLLFHQSPLSGKSSEGTPSAYVNSESASLYHQQTLVTSFQYPFAISVNLSDPGDIKTWLNALLHSIAQPPDVAGNHARSWFPFDPSSIIMQVTKGRTPSLGNYCFDKNGDIPNLSRLEHSDDLAPRAKEFWLGGKIVRDFSEERKGTLSQLGMTLSPNVDSLFDSVFKCVTSAE
jgi:CRISPR-associated protein Cst2